MTAVGTGVLGHHRLLRLGGASPEGHGSIYVLLARICRLSRRRWLSVGPHQAVVGAHILDPDAVRHLGRLFETPSADESHQTHIVEH